MVQIDSSAPALVTGATGYVAGWIVKRLLEAGVTVHAAVRDPQKTEKLRYLTEIAENSAGEIRFFKADLLDEGSFAEAMQGCGTVFHTASPFTSDFTDAQKELVDPALLGTRNVLAQATKEPSVKRVVVTSSCAAIYTDASDCAKAPGGVLTEAVWNSTASLAYQPYSYSKTVAEREAWRIAESQSAWDLVSINPCLVMGPAIGGKPTSESFSIMQRGGGGVFKSGAPRIAMGMVDVRDVAAAHIAAAFTPEASGRHITCGHSTDVFTAMMLLAPKYGADYPLPRRALPKWLVWAVAPFVGMERVFIARNVNIEWKADNRKSKRELGLTYRPLQETLEDMFQYMIEQGYFKKP